MIRFNLLVPPFIITLLLLTLNACTTNSSKPTKINSTPVSDLKSLIYEASGNEPGWNLKIYKNEHKYFYKLVSDYGQTKLEGETNVTEFNKTSPRSVIFGLKKGSKKIIEVKAVNANCTDMAGNRHGTAAEFEYKRTKYIGCGDFVGT